MYLYSKDNTKVITNVKVASRMCEYWFGNPQTKFDLHDILQNENVNLYILYRDPIKRFLSGVYQDFIYNKIEKESVLGELPFELHRIPINHTFTSSEKLIIETHLDKFLEENNNIDSVYNTGHTHLYLKHMYHKYKNHWPKIECKFNLVDIGEHDVDKLFQSILEIPYYKTSTDPLLHDVHRDKSNTVILQQFRNRWISDLVNLKIDKINYSKDIKKLLEEEVIAYKEIKKLQYNLKKELI